ncbi:ParA family protein [Halioxenophilus sp. WMMB6]|uniref:ParA family protein n=1 Tax=Halioxenophilus sp. WMMB6 TaxID=3073815 RepID=UPI00295E6937|nr:ParA family protein [Halioxenophilus sp. WMMB6]
MLVWTVANQKGGVGKTTTAVALAGLAAEQGLRVLMVDLDPHGSLTSYFGENADYCKPSTYTLFELNKNLTRAEVFKIIRSTKYDNLSFLPASTALATLERQAIGKDGLGLVVSRTVELLNNDFDLVVIDSPPLLGVLMINALAACQHLVIPVQTEFLAIKGLERMIHTLQMLGRSRKRELGYTIVPTMFDRRTHASVVSLRAIKNQFIEHAWAGKIPVDTRLRDASKAGVPPHLFEPDGRATSAYRSLLKQLFQQAAVDRKSSRAVASGV